MPIDPNAPRVIIHDLGHAKAALQAASEIGCAVILESPAGAAGYMGAQYFKAVVDQARDAYPGVAAAGVLDCADAPGLALGAIRTGVDCIRVDAAPDVRARIADIAAQAGVGLDDGGRPALDLLDAPDPAAACRDWFAAAQITR
jgi:hypothetical protein